MKKLLIGLFTVFALVTLAACGGSGEDFSKSDEYNDITSDIDALQTELAKAKEDLNKAIADGNSALTEELTNKVNELSDKLESLGGGSIPTFSDGMYKPGTYNGNYYDLGSTDAINNGNDFYMQYISNVVVDSNGNIAGGNDDVVIPYSIDNTNAPFYTLTNGYAQSRFAPISIAGTRVEWDDVDSSESLTTGDVLTFLDEIPRTISAGDSITLDTDNSSTYQPNMFTTISFTELELSDSVSYAQMFFSISKNSYDQHLSLLEKTKVIYDDYVVYLDEEITKYDATIQTNVDAITAAQTAIDEYTAPTEITFETVEKNTIDNTSLSYELDYVYSIYSITDRSAFDTAMQEAQDAVTTKQGEIATKENEIATRMSEVSDKATAIAEALAAYNEAYSTTHEADENGHIDTAVLQAEIDALTVGTDDQQIADGNALITLDNELTTLENDLETDLPNLNAELTALQEELPPLNDALLPYTEYDKLWKNLDKAETALIKNYGPLWKKADLLNKKDDGLAIVAEFAARLEKLPSVKTYLDSISIENGAAMAQEAALMDAMLPVGTKLAVTGNQGEFTPGSYMIDLTLDYDKLKEHSDYFKLRNYVRIITATASLGFVVDTNGNIAGSYTHSITLKEVPFISQTADVPTYVTIISEDENYYSATDLQAEFGDLIDDAKIDANGDYTDIEYEIIYTKESTADYMGEAGGFLEYKVLPGFNKVGDAYISKNGKFDLVNGEYQYFKWMDDGVDGKTWIANDTFTFVSANQKVVSESFDVVDSFTLNFYSGIDIFNEGLLNDAQFASNDTASWSLYYHFIVPNAKA